MSAYVDNITGRGYVFITSDDTADRRSRGAQIAALRKQYESDHKVRLVHLATSYSETYGFLSRTRIRYRIDPA